MQPECFETEINLSAIGLTIKCSKTSNFLKFCSVPQSLRHCSPYAGGDQLRCHHDGATVPLWNGNFKPPKYESKNINVPSPSLKIYVDDPSLQVGMRIYTSGKIDMTILCYNVLHSRNCMVDMSPLWALNSDKPSLCS